jgi:sulfofructose kinase
MPRPRPAVDVLCAGLVCVDLLLSLPHHPAADEKLRATSRLVAPGGPAAVASAQVARLGGAAAFAGFLGDAARDPFSRLLREAFSAAAIDTTAVLAPEGFDTPLATILVKPDATRAVVSHRPDFGRHLPRHAPFPPARVVLADGHRPEWNLALAAHARACLAPLILDAGSWSDSVRELAPHADHLVASEACARSALGDRDPATSHAATLRAALRARADAVLIVTLGARGALLLAPGAAAPEIAPAFRIDAVDTTGAGDAFHGAYALALARGLALAGALRFASAAGALACTRPGAWPALPSAGEVEALLALPS